MRTTWMSSRRTCPWSSQRAASIAGKVATLGKFIREDGHLLEQELDVLELQTDSPESGLRAKWRLESMKTLRQTGLLGATCACSTSSFRTDMDFKAGDLSMYRKAEPPFMVQGASLELTTK